MQHAAGSRKQAAGSRQQAAGNRQQAASSKQQAASSKQQTANCFAIQEHITREDVPFRPTILHARPDTCLANLHKPAKVYLLSTTHYLLRTTH